MPWRSRSAVNPEPDLSPSASELSSQHITSRADGQSQQKLTAVVESVWMTIIDDRVIVQNPEGLFNVGDRTMHGELSPHRIMTGKNRDDMCLRANLYNITS